MTATNEPSITRRIVLASAGAGAEASFGVAASIASHLDGLGERQRRAEAVPASGGVAGSG